MNQPEKITVTLSDFTTVEVQRFSRADFEELADAVRNYRLKTRDNTTPPTGRDEHIEWSDMVPWIVARATGQSQQWAYRLSHDDHQTIMQAIFELHEGLRDEVHARHQEIEKIIRKQKHG